MQNRFQHNQHLPAGGAGTDPGHTGLRRSPERDQTDYEQRHFANLCAAAFLLALALCIGVTLQWFDYQQRLERCLISGRKDCIEIGRTPRGIVEIKTHLRR